MITKEEATVKLNRLIYLGVSKKALIEMLDLTFPTFKKKMNSNDWSIPELSFIETIKFE